MINWIENKLKKLFGFPIPRALSSTGWATYNKRYKATHPVMYFIFEVLFIGISLRIHSWIIYPWANFCRAVRYRFIIKPSVVRIQTLSKYEHCHSLTILLHSSFQVLVDYVEWGINADNRPRWYMRLRNIPILGYLIPKYRDPEAGIKYLKESAGYKYTEESYKEILELYTWWKTSYPTRKDPMELSGMNQYFKDIDEGMDGNKEAFKVVHNRCLELEKLQKEEEEAMLIRLVKVREHLWS